MRIEIFGKNYNPSDSLKAITEKKCAKLERRFEDENAEVTSKGISYRASAMSDSPFDNLDEVIPRLLGQMRKQKDIWGKDKKGTPNVYEEEVEGEEE